MAKILAIVTAVGILAAARWIFNSTAGFNRGLDLVQTVSLVFFIAPLVLAAIVAIVLLARGGVARVPAITLSAVIAAVSLAVTFVPSINPAPVRNIVNADSVRPTDDGLYEYRFEIVNAFQRNATARLFVRDLNGGGEAYIPVNILDGSLGGLSLPRGNFLWGRMEASGEPGQYIFSLPAGRPFQQTYIDGVSFQYQRIGGIGEAVFLIQMETKSAVELFRKMDYRSHARRINNDDGSFLFSYYLELFDTFERGEKTGSEVFLNVIMPQLRRTYAVPLPIDAALLENNILRNRLITERTRWIVLEQTESPGQFAARTTSDLSSDSMSFLIDTLSLTATRTDVSAQ
ncbi:MAG: hypothetical protein FWG66_11635 [Spirochaetes bacterium]|nr:hypothetical protein [Spirochaetota bacterium]